MQLAVNMNKILMFWQGIPIFRKITAFQAVFIDVAPQAAFLSKTKTKRV